MKNIFKDDTVARTLRNASQLTMKVLFVGLAILAVASALQNQYASAYNTPDDYSGQYVPDNSGQYIPDDSGRYVPDHSGDYSPDGLGGYIGDGSGNYKGDNNGYRGDGNGYRGDGNGYRGDGGYRGGSGSGGRGGAGGSGGAGGAGGAGSNGGAGGGSGFGSGFGKGFGAIGNSNLIGQGSNVDKQTVKPSSTFGAGSGFGSGSGSGNGAFGNTAAGSSHVSTKNPGYGTGNLNLSGVRYDQGRYADGRWKIIRQSGDVDTDGYHWEYETENGITAEESGKLHNKGTDLEAMKAKGFFQYTGPDNVLYHVAYTADENGFIPVGNHLPTPPPIPGAILKSLEYLKSIGKL